MSVLRNKVYLMVLIIFSGFSSISMAGVIDIECGTRVNKKTFKVESPRVRLSSSSRASDLVSNWLLKKDDSKLPVKILKIQGGKFTIDGYLFFVQTGNSVGGAVGTAYHFNVKKCVDNLASLVVKTVGGFSGGKSTKYACSCGID